MSYGLITWAPILLWIFKNLSKCCPRCLGFFTEFGNEERCLIIFMSADQTRTRHARQASDEPSPDFDLILIITFLSTDRIVLSKIFIKCQQLPNNFLLTSFHDFLLEKKFLNKEETQECYMSLT